MINKPWSLYIIKCRDDKLYTGISNDVDRRVAAHNKGKGCRYTRCRCPVELVYQEECGTKSSATKREFKVKTFTKQKKLSLINNAK